MDRLLPILPTLLFLLAASALSAEPPPLLSYQGVLMDDQGIVVPDGAYDLHFALYDFVDQISKFEQTLTVEVRKGLYNVVLSSNGMYDLPTVIATNSNLFMEVTVLQNGSSVPTDIVLAPRQQLASVPYALESRDRPEPVVFFASDSSTSITFANVLKEVTPLTTPPLTVPAAGMSVFVDANVSWFQHLSDFPSTLEARLEERVDGGAWGQVAVAHDDSSFNAAVDEFILTHAVIAPAAGSTYEYRVLVKGGGGPQGYTINGDPDGVGSSNFLPGTSTMRVEVR